MSGQVIENGWTRNVLVHQIESGVYRRQGRAVTNFRRTLPSPQSELAQQVLKDPYNFDFLTLGTDVLERDLERGLIEHLRNLFLELGKGFAFVGSQYRLEVAGQDYFLDLLFYHLRLRCYVVIDLKIEEFKPEFAGKMNFYLSAVDDMMRHKNDGASIGLILCKERNKIIVEYALRDTSKPMGVAQYKLTAALPVGLKSEFPTTEDLNADLPVLNLLTLRMQLEKSLVALAKQYQIRVRAFSIRSLAAELAKNKVLSDEVVRELSRIAAVLNAAAHGQPISKPEAERALQLGNSILGQIPGSE
jgi:predicted nuclease of restriction endonuclease-like (RecB) superfamily